MKTALFSLVFVLDIVRLVTARPLVLALHWAQARALQLEYAMMALQVELVERLGSPWDERIFYDEMCPICAERMIVTWLPNGSETEICACGGAVRPWIVPHIPKDD